MAIEADGLFWSDIPKILWREAEKVARALGLTCVEIIHGDRVYTVSILDGPLGSLILYGCVKKP